MFESYELFLTWCHDLNLSEETINLIKTIRTSPPFRKVRSGVKNVSGFFPSKKMRVTIQFESHKNELAHIRFLEDANEVIEYYDQPNQIYLNYKSAKGKIIGVNHTPDFFVIYKNYAGWEECKTEQELAELEIHNPNRYCRDSEGNWRCAPAEEYAETLGLFYRVVSSKNISWTFQRNIEFFEDYFREDNLTVHKEKKDNILSIVSQNPGITLKDLFNNLNNLVTRDDVFSLIALNEIYIDLHKVPIVEFGLAQVFENQELAKAFDKLCTPNIIEIFQGNPFFDIKPGVRFCWNSVWWTVLNIGNEIISLIDDNKNISELPFSFFKQKTEQNQILLECSQRRVEPKDINKKISSANKEALEKANYRFELVMKYLREGNSPESLGIPERTLRSWAKRYEDAEQQFGYGYIGLIECPRSGNKNPKAPIESIRYASKFIEEKYETYKQKKILEVYSEYSLFSESKNISPITYATFCRMVKERPNYEQTLKRQGFKAAYKEEPFYWVLEPTTPRHGERPFHIAHIDHTEADVEMRCSITGKELGRINVSKMIDAYTRRILAKFITFEKPSYRTNMMLIRECVKRFGRLPQTIVVDGGKDFSSVYFDSLLAMFECTKKVRPVAKSRFGSLIERVFETDNTQFFHNLQGNTQITKNVRQITKSNNPKKLSVWNLESLDLKFSEFCYEIYDTNYHSTLGQTPREAFELGMEAYGRREFRFIPYDETFLKLTLPSTTRGYAKIYNYGIKINNIRYWSQNFRNPLAYGKKVQVRFDPWNIGIAYVYFNQNWVEVYSDYYQILKNRSYKEIELASKEIRQRAALQGKNRKITVKKLVDFLRSVEDEEVLLMQRLRDLAQRNVLFSNNLAIFSDGSLLQFSNEDTSNTNQDNIVLDGVNKKEVKCIADFKPCELI